MDFESFSAASLHKRYCAENGVRQLGARARNLRAMVRRIRAHLRANFTQSPSRSRSNRTSSRTTMQPCTPQTPTGPTLPQKGLLELIACLNTHTHTHTHTHTIPEPPEMMCERESVTLRVNTSRDATHHCHVTVTTERHRK